MRVIEATGREPQQGHTVGSSIMPKGGRFSPWSLRS